MKQTYIYGLIVGFVLLLGAIFLMSNGGEIVDTETPATFITEIQQSIGGLETKLDDTAERIDEEELTAEDARETRMNIIADLNQIEAHIGTAQSTTLTNEEQEILQNSLQRLQNIFENHQTTLATIELLAADASAEE